MRTRARIAAAAFVLLLPAVAGRGLRAQDLPPALPEEPAGEQGGRPSLPPLCALDPGGSRRRDPSGRRDGPASADRSTAIIQYRFDPPHPEFITASIFLYALTLILIPRLVRKVSSKSPSATPANEIRIAEPR